MQLFWYSVEKKKVKHWKCNCRLFVLAFVLAFIFLHTVRHCNCVLCAMWMVDAYCVVHINIQLYARKVFENWRNAETTPFTVLVFEWNPNRRCTSHIPMIYHYNMCNLKSFLLCIGRRLRHNCFSSGASQCVVLRRMQRITPQNVEDGLVLVT